MPPTNGKPYHGPYTVFDREELEHIAQLLPIEVKSGSVDDRIHKKLRAALGTDPKLLRPHA